MRLLILFLVLSLNCVAQEQTIGLFEFDQEEAYQGLTLYAPLQSTETYLLNNCGQVVNIWSSEFTPGMAAYLDDQANLWRAGSNRQNTTFQHPGTGGVFEKYNWEGDLLWQTEIDGAHHDFHMMPNGNLLLVRWQRITSDSLVALGYTGDEIEEFWTEVVTEIRPIGTDDFEVVWEWNAIDHVIQSAIPQALNYSLESRPRRININHEGNDGEDWLHVNSIDYNPARDEVLLSVRNFSEVWVIDHSTTIEEAITSMGGRAGFGGDLLFRWGNDSAFISDGNSYLDGQHDAKFQESNISLFDNGQLSGESTPLIVTPMVDADGFYFLDSIFHVSIDSSYVELRQDLELDSPILSSFEILPNDNALICVGDVTNIYELNSAKEVVWHYRGTVSLFGPIEQGSLVIGSTFNVSKYGISDSRFNGRDLSAKAQSIEINPLNIDCQLSEVNTVLDNPRLSGYYFNEGYLYKRNQSAIESNFKLSVYDISGKLVYHSRQPHIHHDLTFLNAGYFIYTVNADKEISKGTFAKN